MNPLHSLDQEALLDALTEYYQRYRRTVENYWNQKEYGLCRETLMAIVSELERRRDPLIVSNEQVAP